MSIWHTATLDVRVDYDDFERARELAIERGQEVDILTVPAEVDIDDALEEATVEQLRGALGKEEAPGYTAEQLDAIRDCFAAAVAGDTHTSASILNRIFEHPAQIAAAESGLSLYSLRRPA